MSLYTSRRRDRFRLAGIDAPEARTPEGVAAALAAEAWFRDLTDHDQVYIQTMKGRQQDKFGRYLAWIYSDVMTVPDDGAPRDQAEADALAQVAGGTCLNVALVQGGHARWYWGIGPR